MWWGQVRIRQNSFSKRQLTHESRAAVALCRHIYNLLSNAILVQEQKREMGNHVEDGIPESKSLEKHQTGIDVNGNPLCLSLSIMNKFYYHKNKAWTLCVMVDEGRWYFLWRHIQNLYDW